MKIFNRKTQSKSGFDTLLEIAKEAKKYKFKVPEDLIENMDYYLYEEGFAGQLSLEKGKSKRGQSNTILSLYKQKDK